MHLSFPSLNFLAHGPASTKQLTLFQNLFDACPNILMAPHFFLHPESAYPQQIQMLSAQTLNQPCRQPLMLPTAYQGLCRGIHLRFEKTLSCTELSTILFTLISNRLSIV